MSQCAYFILLVKANCYVSLIKINFANLALQAKNSVAQNVNLPVRPLWDNF